MAPYISLLFKCFLSLLQENKQPQRRCCFV